MPHENPATGRTSSWRILGLVAFIAVVIITAIIVKPSSTECSYNHDKAIAAALRYEADRIKEIASTNPSEEQIETFRKGNLDCCKMFDSNPLEPNKKPHWKTPPAHEWHFVRLIYQTSGLYSQFNRGKGDFSESILSIDPCNKPMPRARIFNQTSEPVISREVATEPTEIIPKAIDGRNRVQLSDITVLLPDENDQVMNPRVSFWVSTADVPVQFTFSDLFRETNRYAFLLRNVTPSYVTARRTFYVDKTRSAVDGGDILGTPVARGVSSVQIGAGAERDCDNYISAWTRLREAALTGEVDQHGWFRQDVKQSPRTSYFLKFLDPANRSTSRYHILRCDYLGDCSIFACNNGVRAFIHINSVNKMKTNDDYSIAEFDDQITSGKRAIENMLVGKPVDLSLSSVN